MKKRNKIKKSRLMNFFIVAMISSTVLIPLTATATNSINSIYDDGQYLDYIAKQITENLEDDENEESQQDKWLDLSCLDMK